MVLLLLAIVCALVLFVAKGEKFKEKLKEKIERYDPDSDDKKDERATKIWDGFQKTVSQRIFFCIIVRIINVENDYTVHDVQHIKSNSVNWEISVNWKNVVAQYMYRYSGVHTSVPVLRGGVLHGVGGQRLPEGGGPEGA